MKNVSKVIFFVFLVLYLAVGYYFAIYLEVYHNDAIARTALAFFTIFGRNPHLAAIGFVWQPFLSFVEIPLIYLLRPFDLMMMSGPAVTSFFGALSVMLVYKIGVLVNPKNKFLSCLIAILFGLNPLILLYSVVGTSEAVFLFSLIISTYFLIKWYFQMSQLDLLLSGFFIAFSFWSRYESIPVVMAFIFLLVLQFLVKRAEYKKIESNVIQFILPFCFSVGLWILANWMIMKDPFYFLNSVYSNGAFTTSLKNNPQLMENSYHTILGSLYYVGKRILLLSPVIILIPFIFLNFLINIKKKIGDFVLYLFLVLPYFSIIVFHAYQLYLGKSFGWLRFFMYVLVAGTFTTIFIVNKQKYLILLSMLLLVTGVFTTGYSMSLSNYGKEEVSFINKTINNSIKLDFSRTYEDQKKISKFMDETRGMILVDTDKGFAIPLFSKNPKRYVITSDIDYKKIVKSYPKYVDWIIVNKPGADDFQSNLIYKYYPNIWEGDTPSIVFEKAIEGWKIFRIIK